MATTTSRSHDHPTAFLPKRFLSFISETMTTLKARAVFYSVEASQKVTAHAYKSEE